MTKKKRACLFCGDTELTREHVFPQWLLDECNIRKAKMDMEHHAFYGEKISERPLTLNSLINGLICRECNNGWLSQLESQVKPVLINLLNTSDNFVTLLKEHNKLLSMWAFKTAIILNHATNYRNIIPKRHYKYLYKHRRIPENVTVLLGVSKKMNELNWVQSQSVSHKGNESIFNNPRMTDIYKITIQIKHLLIKVIYSPFYECKYAHDEIDHIMLYPTIQVAETAETFELAEDLVSFDMKGSLYQLD